MRGAYRADRFMKQANAVGHQLTSEELHEHQNQVVIEKDAPAVVAVNIKDPANVGSIFRICDAVKSKELILVDCPNITPEKIKRVSRSTSQKIKYQVLSSQEFIEKSTEFGNLTAVEITSKSQDLYIAVLPENTTFIIGGERHGIPENILALCSQAVHIPMFGVNSSMNVATALGITLYEWHRRFRS